MGWSTTWNSRICCCRTDCRMTWEDFYYSWLFHSMTFWVCIYRPTEHWNITLLPCEKWISRKSEKFSDPWKVSHSYKFLRPFYLWDLTKGWGNYFASMRHFSKQTVDLFYPARQHYRWKRDDGKILDPTSEQTKRLKKGRQWDIKHARLEQKFDLKLSFKNPPSIVPRLAVAPYARKPNNTPDARTQVWITTPYKTFQG